MSYHAGSGLLSNRLSGQRAKVWFHLLLFFLCLTLNLLAAYPASAQSPDRKPTRDEVFRAVSDYYPSQACCLGSIGKFSEEQPILQANNAVPAAQDWEGLKRDTWYFMGAQLASLAVIYALPEDVSGWSDEQKEDFSLSKWRENVSNPQIDSDHFVINYVLHPYWGAAYYVRARERGYGKLDSFWYSLFLSTFYEAGPEALFEEPSIQDLIVTPVFGAWLGEYFMDWRSDIRQRTAARGYRSRRDNWLWYLTDPLDLLNTGVDRLFGRDAETSFSPLIGSVSPARWLETNRPNSLLPSPGLRNHSYAASQTNRETQRFAGFSFSISW